MYVTGDTYLFQHIICCTSYGLPGAAHVLRANVKPAHLKVKGFSTDCHSFSCHTIDNRGEEGLETCACAIYIGGYM